MQIPTQILTQVQNDTYQPISQSSKYYDEVNGKAINGIAIKEGNVEICTDKNKDIVFPGISSCLVLVRISSTGERTGAHAVLMPDQSSGQKSLSELCYELGDPSPTDKLMVLGGYKGWEAADFYNDITPENKSTFSEYRNKFSKVDIIDTEEFMQNEAKTHGEAAHHIILANDGKIKINYTEKSSEKFNVSSTEVSTPLKNINGDPIENWVY